MTLPGEPGEHDGSCSSILLAEVKRQIDLVVDQSRSLPVLRYFGSWLKLPNMGVPTWHRPVGVLNYRDVAEAGISAALSGCPESRDFFNENCKLLQQRTYFIPGQATGLENDPVALIGLALGLSDNDSTIKNWLLSLVDEAIFRTKVDKERALLDLARLLVQEEHKPGTQLHPVFQAALSRVSLGRLDEQIKRQALKHLLAPDRPDPEWAFFYAAALEELFAFEAKNISLRKPSLEELCRLLKDVTPSLMRWPWENKAKTKTGTPQRWDIQNEYHVQSLLWAILRPVFPDLEDERYIAKIGPKQPRADLVIPSLRTIIEVKFMRSAKEAKGKTFGELAQDIPLYLRNDLGFENLVAFIWDDSASDPVHSELSKGLKHMGYHDVVFASRPGDWSQN